jgi:hypothetical protein
MNSLSNGPVRRWRRFAGLFALLLVLTSIIPTHATTAGVVNGSFGMPGACTTNSWIATGTYQVSGKYNCIATLTATASTTPTVRIASTLEQRFLVSASDTKLVFYIYPSTNNPETGYPAQTVALYNSAGQLIYQKSRNSVLTELEGGNLMLAYEFSYSLAAYANQYVTLRITAQVQPSQAGSPTSVQLGIDFDDPTNSVQDGGGDPGNVGTGVW